MREVPLRERLDAVGLTQKHLAEKFGVQPSAVSNWLTREKWPEEVEAYIAGLEAPVVVTRAGPEKEAHIALGNLVKSTLDGHSFRVVRVDHCTTFRGETWICWISPVYTHKGGMWHGGGSVTRSPEHLLEDLGPGEWVEPTRESQMKGEK